VKHYSQAAVERAMKVQEIILRAIAKKITWIQAAQIIGISARQMRRWLRRYQQHGYDGLFDRRTGKPSPKRVPLETVEQVLKLYQDRYFDFNVKHFHEKLVSDHQIKLSYTWIKKALQEAGLVKKQRKRRVHRKRRPRRPLPGMLLHIDASKHRWFQDGRFYDLIVLLDDATSEIYYVQLVEEESTRTILAALRQVVEQKGIFCALYSDRASHFFYTPKGGGKVDREQLTQVGRAMKRLSIEMIAAYSPEARGRSERNFSTWQWRLPQELRLRSITTVEAANEFLRASYIGEFNQKFSVKAEQQGTAFVKARGLNLDLIFSIEQERVVGRDNTVMVDKRVLQIEKTKWRGSLAGCRVMVYEHADKSLSIRYGGHEVGRYTQEGKSLVEAKTTRGQKQRKRKGTHPGFNSATEGI
jgi:transposase